MDHFNLAAVAGQYQSKTTFTSADLTIRQCVGNNPNRVSLIFSDSGGNISFGINTANLGANKGEIQMSPGAGWFQLLFRDHGPYIQYPWYCVRNSGGSNLYVTEIFFVPSSAS